ncbi:hypothetical protein BD311DRAFT_754080 [Dichomitus squalens]|uniref:BTB domain-containing protein n=1 Tax=Dichomitus squalens TaxID=114155 RepID=A0A4Q9MRW5_9APHY|nr:hypothetical protein BD311DRAFT_754080 [Dichomitus squalens]
MSQLPAPTFALAPFDNPAADVVLRCRDGVHFRVRSAILLEASPVFAELLAALPCGGATDIQEGPTFEGMPMVVIAEDSDAIDPLLRLCYPTADPVLVDLKDIRPVLAAAIKYQMEEASAVLKKMLLSFLEEQPLRVWAYACLLHLEEEARAAASALLGKELPTKGPEEFHEVSAGDYYRLTKFLRSKGAVEESFTFLKAGSAAAEPPPSKSSTAKPWHCTRELGFTSLPYADIICRSSDGQEFRAHRITLLLASPLLRDGITALCPEAVSGPPPPDALPVLQMGVEGVFLGPLLDMCYAERPPSVYEWHSIYGIVGMMVAARHFGFADILLRLRCGPYLILADRQPLLGYLLAAQLRFPDIAKSRASEMRHDVYESYGYHPEMERTPAHAYHHLLMHRRRSRVLVAAQAAKVGRPAPPPASDTKIQTMAGLRSADGHPWVQGVVRAYADKLGDADTTRDLYRIQPDYEQLLSDSLANKIWCQRCEHNVRLLTDTRHAWKKIRDELFRNDLAFESGGAL